MIDKKELDLILEMDEICHKCIRSFYYYKAVSLKNNNNLWSFTQNCYGEVAIILWCKIFGLENDKTYYLNLFKKNNIEKIDISLSADKVKERLLKKINYLEKKYDMYHNEMRRFRDKWFAHREVGKSVVFPDIYIAKEMCLEMRDIFKELLQKGKVDPSNQNKKNELFGYITQNDNNKLCKELKRESTRLKAARDLSLDRKLLKSKGYI